MPALELEAAMIRRDEAQLPSALGIRPGGRQGRAEAEPFARPFPVRGIAALEAHEPDLHVRHRISPRVLHDAAHHICHPREFQHVGGGNAGGPFAGPGDVTRGPPGLHHPHVDSPRLRVVGDVATARRISGEIPVLLDVAPAPHRQEHRGI